MTLKVFLHNWSWVDTFLAVCFVSDGSFHCPSRDRAGPFWTSGSFFLLALKKCSLLKEAAQGTSCPPASGGASPEWTPGPWGGLEDRDALRSESCQAQAQTLTSKREFPVKFKLADYSLTASPM